MRHVYPCFRLGPAHRWLVGCVRRCGGPALWPNYSLTAVSAGCAALWRAVQRLDRRGLRRSATCERALQNVHGSPQCPWPRALASRAEDASQSIIGPVSGARRVCAARGACVCHLAWRVARGVFVYLAVLVQRAFHAKGFVGLDMTAATTASCALTGVGDPAPARFAAAVTARPVAHVQWMADGDGSWTRGVAQESQDVVAAEARRALVAYFVDVVVLPTDGIGCFCCVMGTRRCVQRKLVASRRAAQNHSGANGFFFRETKGVTRFGLEVFEWQLILRAGHSAARAGLEHGRQNDLNKRRHIVG